MKTIVALYWSLCLLCHFANAAGSSIQKLDNSNANQKQPPEVLCEDVIYKSSTKFNGKHLCRSLQLY